MTVHFYYYKEDLLKHLQQHYEKELKELEVKRHQQAQLDEAERMIRGYFKDFKAAIDDVSEASKGEVCYEEGEDFILMLTIHKNYLKFIRSANAIAVMIGRYNFEEGLTDAQIESYIVPDDKRCVIKKLGAVHQGGHFDVGIIEFYMRETFGHHPQNV